MVAFNTLTTHMLDIFNLKNNAMMVEKELIVMNRPIPLRQYLFYFILF